MWAVAEDGRESTFEQFHSRYPEYSAELEKRRQMVGNLKGSRPHAGETRFVPRKQVRNFGPSRLAVAGIAVLVLASVTLATYATMKIVNGKREAPAPVDSVDIVFNPPDFGTEPMPIQPEVTDKPLQETDVQPLRETPEMEDVYMGLVTVQSNDTSLEKAIRDMATQAGLDLTIAPGFQDKRIRISYVKKPCFAALQELGGHFGFTAFKQGSTQILIVPAVDGRLPSASGVPGELGTEGTETSGGGMGTAKVNSKGPDQAGTTGGEPDEPGLPWPF
jgi:hypothetical protein